MAQLGSQTSSSMFKMLDTSPSKRNKRKSAEPIKRLSSSLEQEIDNQRNQHRSPLATQFNKSFNNNSCQTAAGQNDKCYYKRAKLEQTSDGEDHHTSPSPRLSSR